jgi:NAD(P)-dependent dehydrogenase (short-subunit alcohol dehydrogenase family)
MDLAAWRRALQLEVKSLFALARAAGSDLRAAGARGDAWLLAATGLGDPADLRAPLTGQAGIGGLVRTIAVEWPEVRCRTVNLDADAAPAATATRLLSELADRDAPPDVGYRGDQRVQLVPVAAPIDARRRRAPRLGRDSVVLVTGGAVGITAEIAHELAQRYAPRLVLVGRSALPDDEEPADVRGVTAVDELRAALTRRLAAGGARVTPARVEDALRRLRKEREMRENVARLRAAGATVHYVAADVRDPQRFGVLIDDVYRNFGRLDGLVHGAGLIEDKLVQDKTRESFDRVFDTKADSAFLLARKLRAEQLEFAVFFTSIAGVFGNRGQADYAAANEVVNQVAQELAQRAPGKVCALNWGPWGKTGMVSPELERQFEGRGIPLVPVDGGRALFAAELEIAHGADEVKIVAGGWAWKT